MIKQWMKLPRLGWQQCGLGGAISLGVVVLALLGPSYVWLAVLVFGVVAAGLTGVGVFAIMHRAKESAF